MSNAGKVASPAGRLAGKLAVVSGSSSGIGQAIALTFSDEGAQVVGLDLVEPNEPVPGASARIMDVTSEQQWLDLAAELEPDILVNNAGGLLDSSVLHEHTTDSWQRTIELNLTSVFLGMRSFLPKMIAGRGGSIINIGSMSGQRGQSDAAAYQAAKAGVAMLTRNAAITYARFGVRVNTVTPSVVETEALAHEPSARTDAFVARVPLGRAASPREVAAAALFLASDDSSFVTGADIAVDGGYLA